MKTILLAGVTAAALAFGATTAQASISLSGGVVGNIPGAEVTNNALIPLGFSTPLGGYYGSQITATMGILTFEFLGYEAGANNTFTYTGGGGGSFSTGAYRTANGGISNVFNINGLVPSFSRYVADGTVGFTFATDFGGGLSVANGSNPTEINAPNTPVINFFAHIGHPPGGSANGDGGTTGDVVYLFLDDTGSRRLNVGGSGFVPDDDNHDDMVVRITWTPVPEPASLALLGAGLLGLGAATRRRKA